MGFPGYFLIVADFIQWAKDNDVPVGPGRGSGAGSLVAYALKITDLDPLEHDLLFERFLNPERVSMPDFDVDFCMDKRDRVIDYVARKYGRDSVSQIITYGIDGGQGGGARRRPRARTRLRLYRPGRKDGAVRDRHDPRQGAGRERRPQAGLRAGRGGHPADRHGASSSRAWRATPASTPAAW